MNPITRYSAIFLLLLFVRVMVPDAVLLGMHHHAHTEHTDTAAEVQAKVEKEHTHCPVDKLFDSPFQGSFQVAIITPVALQKDHKSLLVASWPSLNIDLKKQRGPPVV